MATSLTSAANWVDVPSKLAGSIDLVAPLAKFVADEYQQDPAKLKDAVKEFTELREACIVKPPEKHESGYKAVAKYAATKRGRERERRGRENNSERGAGWCARLFLFSLSFSLSLSSSSLFPARRSSRPRPTVVPAVLLYAIAAAVGLWRVLFRCGPRCGVDEKGTRHESCFLPSLSLVPLSALAPLP